MLTFANVLIIALEIYVLIGVLFALVFVYRGVGRIDPAAEDGSWGFRLLILPGAVALWPLLARRWLAGVEEPPVEDNAHRRAARTRR